MPNSWHLGNDIVDLTDPRHRGKAAHRRFLQRVFCTEEAEAILASSNPDQALWIRWAGKEAAFKTISKRLGTPPTFVHPEFWVRIAPTSPPEGRLHPKTSSPVTRFGEVSYAEHLLPLRVEIVGSALHAVTWIPSSTGAVPSFSWATSKLPEIPSDWKSLLRPRFSSLEWACVSHRASAWARLAARHSLARALGVEEDHVEIGCGPGKPGHRIPRVLVGGEEVPVDLTLSHHGRLLAWAFLLDERIEAP